MFALRRPALELGDVSTRLVALALPLAALALGLPEALDELLLLLLCVCLYVFDLFRYMCYYVCCFVVFLFL